MVSTRASAGTSAFLNLHNQGIVRAEYQGARGNGFTVEFLAERAARELNIALGAGVIAFRGASIAAVVSSTDELKQKMRTFLDGHFTGSALHGNNHRRVSNASVQSVYYDDIESEGQFTSLIYSKFGYRGNGGFVDFLLLHIRGGTIRPESGEWLRIPNLREPGARNGQTGFFPVSGSDIFFTPSKDGKKLYQLRRSRNGGETKLLATLVKSLAIKPSLQGLETIMAQRRAIFERDFDAELAKLGAGAV